MISLNSLRIQSNLKISVVFPFMALAETSNAILQKNNDSTSLFPYFFSILNRQCPYCFSIIYKVVKSSLFKSIPENE